MCMSRRMLAIGLAACALFASLGARARTLNDILASKKIVFGVNPNQPPLGLYDAKNDIDGFDVSIAKGIADSLGVKLENNSYSGLDVMPNVRLAWQFTGADMLWASFSQAVRTPSKIDRELQAPGILLASPNFASEKLTAYELGYRGEPAPAQLAAE